MREADVLFELIQSLDEKEYKFVQEAAKGDRGRPTQREQLLADLRKQETYNPQLLRPKYKNYEVLRYQVRQLTMKALRSYHENSNIDLRIATHLFNEQIFYTKGLYNQAEKELDDAQKLAEQYQKLGRLLEILQLKQFRLVERQTKELNETVSANLAYIAQTLAAYQAQIQAFHDYQALFAAYRIEGKTEVEDSWAVQLDPKRQTFYRDLYQNASQSLAAQIRGDLTEAVLLAEAALRLFESEPEIKDEQLLKFKIQLANLGVVLAGAERYAEVEEIVRQIKQFEIRDFNDEAETFQNTIHLELILMVNQRKFEGQNNLIERVEDGLKKYEKKINAARRLSLLYNLLVLYFVNENFRAGLKVVDMILELRKLKVRKEVQYTTRLLLLVMYYELPHFDLLDDPITAARRYLERKKKRSGYKSLLVKYLFQLGNTPDSKKEATFRELYRHLATWFKEGTQSDNLGLALVAAWVRSKLEKRSIKECLQNPPAGGAEDAAAPVAP